MWATIPIALWFVFNIVSNVEVKMLFYYSLPVTYIVAFQSIVGAFVAVVWNLISGKRVLSARKRAVAPAFMHTVTHGARWLAALHGHKSPKFLKVTEPLFTVVMTYLVQGRKPSLAVIAALAIVMSGIATASISSEELTFSGILEGVTPLSALLALATNVGAACRVVLSKQLMTGNDKKEKGEQGQEAAPTGGELYDEIALISAVFALGTALIMDGDKLTDVMSELDDNMLTKIVIGGVAYHLYHRFAFSALELLPALTMSVASSVRTSVFQVTGYYVFGSQISTHGACGAGVSAFGVALLAYAGVETSTNQSIPKGVKSHTQIKRTLRNKAAPDVISDVKLNTQSRRTLRNRAREKKRDDATTLHDVLATPHMHAEKSALDVKDMPLPVVPSEGVAKLEGSMPSCAVSNKNDEAVVELARDSQAIARGHKHAEKNVSAVASSDEMSELGFKMSSCVIPNDEVVVGFTEKIVLDVSDKPSAVAPFEDVSEKSSTVVNDTTDEVVVGSTKKNALDVIERYALGVKDKPSTVAPFEDLPELRFEVSSSVVNDTKEEVVVGSVEDKKEERQQRVLQPCLNCQSLTHRRCARCKTAFICSRDCQVATLAQHKQECMMIYAERKWSEEKAGVAEQLLDGSG